MKEKLYYLSFVMFVLGIFVMRFFPIFSEFSMSISLLLLCVGCIFEIPVHYAGFKVHTHDNYWIRCTATLVFMILGSIAFFVLAIAFLPCFGL